MAGAYTSTAALRAAIMKEMRDAMAETQAQAQDDMEMAIQTVFYEGGIPVKYVRTMQLGSTPQTSSISGGGTSISFEAKLNDGGGYSTGKKPSMAAVLQLTNKGTSPGLRPAIGGTGYWGKAEHEIEQHLNSNMEKHFSGK